MSGELVPSPRRIALEEQHAADRRAALEALNAEAATADAERSRQIMLQARHIAEVLKELKAPYEEAWLAGKASVVASRRLGRILCELPSRGTGLGKGAGKGAKLKSPRTAAKEELGLSDSTAYNLVLLATKVPDPEFQRYIQRKDRIPTMTGALAFCNHQVGGNVGGGGQWHTQRRRKVKIKTPLNPSVDAAYSHLVQMLGHLDGCERRGNSPRGRDLSQALNLLYQVEDLLKPYRAGYDGTGRKAA